MPSLPQTPSPSERPALAVAMPAGIERLIFDDGLRERLRLLARVVGDGPIVSFDAPGAEAALAEAEILLTGWGCPPLGEEVLRRAPHLRLVAHAAGTVKDFVTAACWRRGLRVVSAAEANAVPVAEFTLAAILLSGKHAFHIRELYRAERRQLYWGHRTPGIGNLRRRVGLVGASRIGRRVLELLRPFDLEVALHDPTLGEAEASALGVPLVPLPELCSWCDTLSLHAPSLPSTRHMIGEAELARLRDGATLINTARGALVDHTALERELVAGRLQAVIDVTEPEVLPAESPLYELPNVFLTPHIAGSEGPETRRMTALALDEVERFVRGRPLRHEVREADLERIA